MDITIERTYYDNGTNGTLYINGLKVCHTIELPWHQNKRGISCIPEGTYMLEKRSSPARGKHLQVMHVSNRDLILIHPANDAKAELRGCIAPVTVLSAPGRGNRSRLAFEMVRDAAYEAIDKDETVWITLTSKKIV
jgi:hypothetical protein